MWNNWEKHGAGVLTTINGDKENQYWQFGKLLAEIQEQN